MNPGEPNSPFLYTTVNLALSVKLSRCFTLRCCVSWPVMLKGSAGTPSILLMALICPMLNCLLFSSGEVLLGHSVRQQDTHTSIPETLPGMRYMVFSLD